MRRILAALTLFALAAPAGAEPPATSPAMSLGLVPLRVMRDKNIITEAEYESALADMATTLGMAADESLNLVVGKWSAAMYGFVEGDYIYDTTQSFSDFPANGQVARPGTLAANNDRMMFSARNSRLGFRVRAPETHGVRASATLEMDFFGYDPGPPAVSEAQFFVNPTFRFRHLYFKLENPIVDILVGQTWDLFGWQSQFQPNTVEIQGVVGEVYSRTPQLRLSKTFKSDAVTVDVAVAAMRPPQRDAAVPEVQGGVKLAYNKWTAVSTVGAVSTSIAPLAVGISGDWRRYRVPAFSASPSTTTSTSGWGLAADAFIPILPGTKHKMGNSLALDGEFVYGEGIADVYSGLSGGVANSPIPPAMMGGMPGTYTPDVDGGLVAFTADGTLHPIAWMSYLVGVQYHLPVLDGNLWVSGNYAHTESPGSSANSTKAIADGSQNPAKAITQFRAKEDWFDANVFWDATDAVRVGLGYSHWDDHYVDGKDAVNHRVQLSAYYLF